MSAIVVDLGSSTVKAGYAGEDTPKAVFPSTVGWLEKDGGDVEMKEAKDDKRSKKKGADKEEDKDDKKAAPAGDGETKEYFVGDASFRRDHMEMTSPFDDEGLIEDWDVVEAIWEHTLRKRLVVRAVGEPARRLLEVGGDFSLLEETIPSRRVRALHRRHFEALPVPFERALELVPRLHRRVLGLFQILEHDVGDGVAAEFGTGRRLPQRVPVVHRGNRRAPRAARRARASI